MRRIYARKERMLDRNEIMLGAFPRVYIRIDANTR